MEQYDTEGEITVACWCQQCNKELVVQTRGMIPSDSAPLDAICPGCQNSFIELVGTARALPGVFHAQRQLRRRRRGIEDYGELAEQDSDDDYRRCRRRETQAWFHFGSVRRERDSFYPQGRSRGSEILSHGELVGQENDFFFQGRNRGSEAFSHAELVGQERDFNPQGQSRGIEAFSHGEFVGQERDFYDDLVGQESHFYPMGESRGTEDLSHNKLAVQEIDFYPRGQNRGNEILRHGGVGQESDFYSQGQGRGSEALSHSELVGQESDFCPQGRSRGSEAFSHGELVGQESDFHPQRRSRGNQVWNHFELIGRERGALYPLSQSRGSETFSHGELVGQERDFNPQSSRRGSQIWSRFESVGQERDGFYPRGRSRGSDALSHGPSQSRLVEKERDDDYCQHHYHRRGRQALSHGNNFVGQERGCDYRYGHRRRRDARSSGEERGDAFSQRRRRSEQESLQEDYCQGQQREIESWSYAEEGHQTDRGESRREPQSWRHAILVEEDSDNDYRQAHRRVSESRGGLVNLVEQESRDDYHGQGHRRGGEVWSDHDEDSDDYHRQSRRRGSEGWSYDGLEQESNGDEFRQSQRRGSQSWRHGILFEEESDGDCHQGRMSGGLVEHESNGDYLQSHYRRGIETWRHGVLVEEESDNDYRQTHRRESGAWSHGILVEEENDEDFWQQRRRGVRSPSNNGELVEEDSDDDGYTQVGRRGTQSWGHGESVVEQENDDDYQEVRWRGSEAWSHGGSIEQEIDNTYEERPSWAFHAVQYHMNTSRRESLFDENEQIAESVETSIRAMSELQSEPPSSSSLSLEYVLEELFELGSVDSEVVDHAEFNDLLMFPDVLLGDDSIASSEVNCISQEEADKEEINAAEGEVEAEFSEPEDLNSFDEEFDREEWEEVEGDEGEVIGSVLDEENENENENEEGEEEEEEEEEEDGNEEDDEGENLGETNWEEVNQMIHNQIFVILGNLEAHAIEVEFEISNALSPFDYVDDGGYEQVLQQIWESDDVSQRGPPPASKAVVESLPRILITPKNMEDDDGPTLCPICKDLFTLNESATQLPCQHLYHGECILPWLCTRNSCPICRYELLTDDANYEQYKLQHSSSLFSA